ncbi:MAG: hypothetical protein ACK56F_16665, partial [bacterium]
LEHAPFAHAAKRDVAGLDLGIEILGDADAQFEDRGLAVLGPQHQVVLRPLQTGCLGHEEVELAVVLGVGPAELHQAGGALGQGWLQAQLAQAKRGPREGGTGGQGSGRNSPGAETGP